MGSQTRHLSSGLGLFELCIRFNGINARSLPMMEFNPQDIELVEPALSVLLSIFTTELRGDRLTSALHDSPQSLAERSTILGNAP